MPTAENGGRARKVVELEQLGREVAALQAQGRKVVQCHGVFDLLHIGHIRHLEQARKFGDALVVTVTPDRFVNKGPHRPVFHETLRAEALAALSCVDFVAINRWPTAVEALGLVRPNFYVKGSEYSSAQDDRTGGIQKEQTAVEAAGGQIVFTHDITFSSSNLINRCVPVFSPEVTAYLQSFAARHPIAAVIESLERIRKLKVLVVGEAIIDEYQYCEAIGKSSKEPMLAVRYLSMEKFAGGILAVANNLANFCDQAGLVTFLGRENSQEEFISKSLNEKIARKFLYWESAPTIVKRRFIERYFFTKMLEVYEVPTKALGAAECDRLCEALEEELPKYDLVIALDFGHEMLNGRAIDLLCRKSRFLALNAQSNAGNLGFHTIAKYPRADYICVAEKEIRLEARDLHSDLREMILDVAGRLNCGRVAITRGSRGCLLYDAKEGFSEVPALAGQVIDRMGAGDAFLSITAPCVAAGVPLEVVGFIGNAVGAQAVATIGHRSSIERVSLMRQIESLLK